MTSNSGRRARSLTFMLFFGSLTFCTGCESPPRSPSASTSADSGRPASVPTADLNSEGAAPNSGPARRGSGASASDARPAVIWNEVVIEWSDLRPRLAERSGGTVLEEMLIDRRLEQVLSQRGITLSADAIAQEEQLLLQTLAPSRERAETLLRELRLAQGLGRQRWNDLLRRNAALRALIAEEVRVTDEAVIAALDAAHGPKRVCRIIAVPDVRTAESIGAQLAGGLSFADLAVERSTDRSAERGGLLAPISRLDPNYPQSFRSALWSLAPGQVSAPVLLDRAWVIIRLEREIPAEPAINDPGARERARMAVRRAQERLLMENYARSILRDTSNATIFDDALLESWRAVRVAAPTDARR
ncbi:MAG: peptidylprolyl isomerase [Phycisphaeraceae bacterium]|nr:peptidylprolyl isomerase [Phycisphaeraceae bacterium]